MPRPLITGIYLENPIGWRLSTGEIVTPTEDNPGYITGDISFELDSLGFLSGSFDIKYTKRPPWMPYNVLVRLDVLDAVLGWQEVILMRPINKQGNDVDGWSITFSPVEDIEAGAFYSGTIPPQSLAWNQQYNLSGTSPVPATDRWTDTNETVMGDAVSAYTTSTWGVDANKRAVLGPANIGTPVHIPFEIIRKFNCDGYELADYATEGRVDPGEGWNKQATESGATRPAYIPKKGVTGKATFNEKTLPRGAALKAAGVVRTEPKYPEIGDPPIPDPLPPDWVQPHPFKSVAGGNGSMSGHTHTGTSKAFYMVWDFQDWYDRSALVKTNLSDYEPLAATIKVGMRLDSFRYDPPPTSYFDLPPQVIYMRSAWISSSSEPDMDAVQQWLGGIEESPPTSVSGRMVDALDTDWDRSIGAPQRSSQTIDVADKQPPIRLTTMDVNKVILVPFKIDEKLFRENLTVASEDGSRPAYGRHYVHILASWGIEVADLSRAEATVTFIIDSLEFKQKLLGPPDFSEVQYKLDGPDLIGPIHSGEVPGIVITPATMGIYDDGVQTISNVRVNIQVGGGGTSGLRTLTPPRRNGSNAKQVKNETRK